MHTQAATSTPTQQGIGPESKASVCPSHVHWQGILAANVLTHVSDHTPERTHGYLFECPCDWPIGLGVVYVYKPAIVCGQGV